MEIDLSVRIAVTADAKLGEGVIWDSERALVWFVDIKRQRLWRLDPETGAHSNFEAPAPIGWAMPTLEGPLLCGLKDGLYLFDPDTSHFTWHAEVPGEPATNRLNDACTDRWGRVWFGSMDDAEEAASGRFYVYNRGEIRAAGPNGICITNGPAVNSASDRIFFTDTLAKTIWVADLAEDGIGEPMLFADTSRHFPDAYPDGPVVDSQEHLWTGLYNGGCVARFSPDGELVATVKIPARDVTKLAFGGRNLGTAFVTTATKNMSAADMAELPQSGSLFAFESPVAGFSQPRAKLD
ncbi:SMP-30/gluconolactonase/LRE family protein [Erythrobacter sp. THAF29]|uniref:SMP-30/gluconolactonase/LRE family protein n=1 Tax=Erythrobacter sp. THAF29 TaxID=2587851 RepID=UPI001267EEB1|nr:SMP-30/gluconolactonase/LRE family protein [Erythrobacter sp. THAF29]QFT78708.1 L-arabinolactonase [Erythrobacter sp. THAF29]